MPRPRVSAWIPCYNYAGYVAESIESLQRQTLGDALEIIVVDDASTDDSWSVIQRYAVDPRVTLVRHERNQGHLATYEDAMSRCRAEYLVGLSADDVCVDPDALAAQADLLDREPSVGFVYTDLRIIDGASRTIATKAYGRPRTERGRDVFRRLMLHGNLIPHPGTMIRRRCFGELGTYDPEFFHSADWELWLRFSTRFDVGHIARPLYGYRMHDANMHVIPDYGGELETRRQVLTKAMTYAPDPELKKLFGPSMARGYTERAHIYMRTGHIRRGFADLIAAARTDPRSLGTPEALKALVLGAAGPARSSLVRLRRAIRAERSP